MLRLRLEDTGNVNVLVITYWSYKEPLIQAYTLPYLRIMSGLLGEDAKIHLFTLEKPNMHLSDDDRRRMEDDLRNHGMVTFSRGYHRFGLRAMVAWLLNLITLARYCRRNKIAVLHAFGSPAGTSAHILSILTRLPYIIDSYEPHAEAMVENGSWKKRSLAYLLLIAFERLQTRRACAVLATTAAMSEYAAKTYRHVPRVLIPRPACVDTEQFNYTKNYARTRADIGFTDEHIVCVYAGKIGGIYLKQEIFDFFKACCDFWGARFRVIMLSDVAPAEMRQLVSAAGLPDDTIFLRQVPHTEVAAYLAMADFGINPVKPVPSKRYCTSIKDGEYWAMGLPVVIPAHISDDSELIRRYRIGAVLDRLDRPAYDAAVRELDQQLAPGRSDRLAADAIRRRIRDLADTHRGMAIAEHAYGQIYGSQGILRQEQKRFLVLIYNSFRDPLFHNLVFRYIARQSERNLNYTFDLITFEQKKYAFTREAQRSEQIRLTGKGIYWSPLTYHSGRFMLLKKLYDFASAAMKALSIGLFNGNRMIIAFANTSGAISYVLAKIINTRLLVYSFEPHSEFMAEFGTWQRTSWQYRMLNHLEGRMARNGDYLLTGTHHMVTALQGEARGKVYRAPSGVDASVFVFNPAARERLRRTLEVDERRVLIYAGKFGGIYYDQEIPQFCSKLIELDPLWFFVFVSPSDHEVVHQRCQEAGLSPSSYHLLEAFSPGEVADWLSMADMGLTAIPPYPSQRFRSPVKVGEYLMCGLPYITCAGVSEDDEWALKHRVGVVVDSIGAETAREAHEGSLTLLNEHPDTLRQRCRETGIAYRGRHLVDDAFDDILKQV